MVNFLTVALAAKVVVKSSAPSPEDSMVEEFSDQGTMTADDVWAAKNVLTMATDLDPTFARVRAGQPEPASWLEKVNRETKEMFDQETEEYKKQYPFRAPNPNMTLAQLSDVPTSAPGGGGAPSPHSIRLAGLSTSQSTTGWGGSASRAVDGNANGHYGGGSCTHTGWQAQPWWKVTFPFPMQIKTGYMVNRADCCCGRLAAGGLRISVDGTHVWSAPHGYGCGAHAGFSINRVVNKELKLYKTGHELLTICEMVLYGQPANFDIPSKNEPTPNGLPPFLGCYTDDGYRDLKRGPRTYGFDAPGCDMACESFKYFTLQHNGWCACDEVFGRPGYYHVSDFECNQWHDHCTGDTYGECGAGWRNAVYAHAPAREFEGKIVTIEPSGKEWCLEYKFMDGGTDRVEGAPCDHGGFHAKWKTDKQGRIHTLMPGEPNCLALSGTDAFMKPCSNNANQKFKWYDHLDTGKMTFRSAAATGKCMDYHPGNRKAYMHPCHYGWNQLYKWTPDPMIKNAKIIKETQKAEDDYIEGTNRKVGGTEDLYNAEKSAKHGVVNSVTSLAEREHMENEQGLITEGELSNMQMTEISHSEEDATETAKDFSQETGIVIDKESGVYERSTETLDGKEQKAQAQEHEVVNVASLQNEQQMNTDHNTNELGMYKAGQSSESHLRKSGAVLKKDTGKTGISMQKSEKKLSEEVDDLDYVAEDTVEQLEEELEDNVKLVESEDVDDPGLEAKRTLSEEFFDETSESGEEAIESLAEEGEYDIEDFQDRANEQIEENQELGVDALEVSSEEAMEAYGKAKNVIGDAGTAVMYKLFEVENQIKGLDKDIKKLEDSTDYTVGQGERLATDAALKLETLEKKLYKKLTDVSTENDDRKEQLWLDYSDKIDKLNKLLVNDAKQRTASTLRGVLGQLDKLHDQFTTAMEQDKNKNVNLDTELQNLRTKVKEQTVMIKQHTEIVKEIGGMKIPIDEGYMKAINAVQAGVTSLAGTTADARNGVQTGKYGAQQTLQSEGETLANQIRSSFETMMSGFAEDEKKKSEQLDDLEGGWRATKDHVKQEQGVSSNTVELREYALQQALFALHKIAPAIAEDGSVMSGALKDLTDQIGVKTDGLIPQMHDMLTQAVAESLKHFGETDENVHQATERLQFEVGKAVESLMEMATQDRKAHEEFALDKTELSKQLKSSVEYAMKELAQVRQDNQLKQQQVLQEEDKAGLDLRKATSKAEKAYHEVVDGAASESAAIAKRYKQEVTGELINADKDTTAMLNDVEVGIMGDKQKLNKLKHDDEARFNAAVVQAGRLEDKAEGEIHRMVDAVESGQRRRASADGHQDKDAFDEAIQANWATMSAKDQMAAGAQRNEAHLRQMAAKIVQDMQMNQNMGKHDRERLEKAISAELLSVVKAGVREKEELRVAMADGTRSADEAAHDLDGEVDATTSKLRSDETAISAQERKALAAARAEQAKVGTAFNADKIKLLTEMQRVAKEHAAQAGEGKVVAETTARNAATAAQDAAKVESKVMGLLKSLDVSSMDGTIEGKVALLKNLDHAMLTYMENAENSAEGGAYKARQEVGHYIASMLQKLSKFEPHITQLSKDVLRALDKVRDDQIDEKDQTGAIEGDMRQIITELAAANYDRGQRSARKLKEIEMDASELARASTYASGDAFAKVEDAMATGLQQTNELVETTRGIGNQTRKFRSQTQQSIERMGGTLDMDAVMAEANATMEEEMARNSRVEGAKEGLDAAIRGATAEERAKLREIRAAQEAEIEKIQRMQHLSEKERALRIAEVRSKGDSLKQTVFSRTRAMVDLQMKTQHRIQVKENDLLTILNQANNQAMHSSPAELQKTQEKVAKQMEETKEKSSEIRNKYLNFNAGGATSLMEETATARDLEQHERIRQAIQVLPDASFEEVSDEDAEAAGDQIHALNHADGFHMLAESLRLANRKTEEAHLRWASTLANLRHD